MYNGQPQKWSSHLASDEHILELLLNNICLLMFKPFSQQAENDGSQPANGTAIRQNNNG